MATPRHAPAHLSPDARALYLSVVADYQLEPWHLGLLLKAFEALGRADQARDEIGSGPLLVKSRLGELRPNPLLAVERDSRARFAALMRQLGLDMSDGPAPATRPRR